MTTKTLANLEQLRLNILRVDDPQMRHDGPIEEQAGLVPGPAGRRQHSAGSESRGGLVALVGVGLDVVVRGNDHTMVGLEGVGAGNLVVWASGSGKLLDMRSHALLVMGLGKLLILDKLGLKGLFPLSLGIELGLCDSGLRVCQGGSNGLLVDDMIVRLREVDVGGGVGGIVRFDMGQNGLLDLEVGFADAGRRLVAFLERGGAAEENGEDGVPGQESVRRRGLEMPDLETDHKGRGHLPGYNIENPSYHTRPTAWALPWCDSGAGRVTEGGLDRAIEAIDTGHGIRGAEAVDGLLGVAVDSVDAIDTVDTV